jgi:hypothetical protein
MAEVVEAKTLTSLMPRLWPKLFTEEAFEEMVLLRLGAALFEKTE